MAFNHQIEAFISALATDRYYVWDHFLDSSEIQAIREAIPDDELHEARIGHKDTLQNNKSIRGDQTLWLDTEMAPPIQDYLVKMDEIRQILNREFFLGLKDFETHFARYEPGTYYKMHIDNPKGVSRRKVTTVLYLNEDWKPGDGGELEVYNLAQEKILTVEPIAGRIIFFLSEDFPHEVTTTNVVRDSITGWYLTEKLL